MKIQYLGTAAAEGCPALFCQCETCKAARALGGKNIRTRSQAMIDGKLGIDFPADAYMHELLWGLDYSAVRHFIFTHAHRDHFYPQDLTNTHAPYGIIPGEDPEYHVYGSADITDGCRETEDMKDNVKLHTLEAYRTYRVGEYDVTPVKANHGTAHPFNYVISDGEKTLFYMHDSGRPFDETFAFFRDKHICFDLVSFDCTSGSAETMDYGTHMCLGYNRVLRAEFIADGFADEKTVFVVNHFSHNGEHVLYEDRAVYEKEGFVMSCDGLVIEF